MAFGNRTSAVQTLYIDALTVATVNDTALPYAGQLGQTYEKNGLKYQLVQVKATSGAVIAGTAVMWSDFDDFVVSATVSDAKRNYIAGVALGTVTAGNYCFIQVAGPATVLFSQGSTRGGTDAAAGEVCIMSATDGSTDRVAAGTAPTYIPLGVFTAAATGGTASINIIAPVNF